MTKGYIYVIDPHINVQGRPVVKIGHTTRSPSRRLKEIQTALPHRASLIHVSEFPDVKWAEKSLHQFLSKRNVRAQGGKEFFFLNSKEAIEIVNTLAYQVSASEAKRALDHDLDSFIDKVSNNLPGRIAGICALVIFSGIIALMAKEISLILLLFAFVAVGPAIFGGVAGLGIGKSIAQKIWKEQIASERARLLEKYPAANAAA